VYLSAVHPTLVNRIYVRAEGNAGEPDRLLVSDDAGESFRVAVALPGGMLGFALSPDGARVAVGGPVAGVWVAAADTVDAAAATFTQRSATPVTCLTWGEEGLYACGLDETSAGFALGRSADEGATFEPLLRALGDVCGPRTDCPVDSTYPAVCPPRWPAVRATLAASGAAGSPACLGPRGGAGGGGSAGAPGEDSSHGSGPAAASAAPGSGSCAFTPHAQRQDGNGGVASFGWWWAAGALGAAWRRRWSERR
jgi:hypothetical protein